MFISGYYKESINEGLGLRAVVFISGCKHGCQGCFNREAWNFRNGEEFTINEQLEVIEDIKSNPLLSGLTLCGGDPFFSARDASAFLSLCREHIPDLNVWAYSGFTFEEIKQDEDMLELLMLCDVLIDGKFIENEKDTTLQFRGSKNQRVIDVKRSLKTNVITILTNVV